jgi:DNA adenine methylase
MAFYTPLRYPGGKGKLAKHVKTILQHNDLCDGHYAEVYAGGAGIAMELLLEGYSAEIHINDLNHSIYAFWFSVLNFTDELCKQIQDIPVTIEVWNSQKEIQKNYKNHSILELGFSTFFLNRTNRSGIINGGIIGGKLQDGKWKIDARFTRSDLIERIERIANKNRFIHLTNLDALEFIKTKAPTLPKKTLIYFDPPYYVKGKGLYDNYYNHDDHLEVANAIKRIKKYPWIISYDDVEEIKTIYQELRAVRYNLNYTAADRYKGTEVMFFSKDLVLPPIDGFLQRAA